MLDAGVYATIDDLAKAKRIAKTYVSAILRLTLLAPVLVGAILDVGQPAVGMGGAASVQGNCHPQLNK